MRRLATLLVSLLFAGGAVLATSATPAQAIPGWALEGVYSVRSECTRVGIWGVQNDHWDTYICEFRQYGTSSYWFLWSNEY